MTPQQIVASRAAKGARAALQTGGKHRQPRSAEEPMRYPRWRDIAIRSLRRLRLDIAAGLPREALLERMDDELFKLQRKESTK